MPGSLLESFRGGSLAEYLAQYFLSSIGVSVPVPRQEDIGVDFYCALSQKDNKRLTFHSPFTVQVGAEGAKKFAYGGLDKNGRWQKEQVEWLFSQELPFFLCIVDKKTLHFSMYTTSRMWMVHYLYQAPTEILFIPDKTTNDDKPEEMQEYKGTGGDGRCHRIALGSPIVAIDIKDLSTEKVDRAKSDLKNAIEMESLNLTYRRLKVHYCQWPQKTFPANPLSDFVNLKFLGWNDEPGRNTSEQLKGLLPIIVALAHNYKAQGKTSELVKLKGVVELIRGEDLPILDLLTPYVPELCD